ncbi:MAG: (d)CMP kinase [Clostridia bacterium]|nr:(d)CMP kinase [Clostridia bacterium]
MKIAIDGPAGAGKSTISKAAAKRLGFVYIDTGAMYRGIGLAAVRRGIDTKDVKGVISILDQVEITIKHNEEGQQIFLNGENVSTEIRLPEISVAASNVAVIPEVRLKLVELQRALAEKEDVIMDGRDIGTYVLPDAEVKIFLSASVEERAKRRLAELIEKGVETDLEAVRTDMEYRDKNDSGREFAPLKPAEDSIPLDNTNITIEEAVEFVCNLANRQRGVK